MLNSRIARSIELATVDTTLGIFEYQSSSYDHPRFVIGDHIELELFHRPTRPPTTSRRNHR